ncbi:MAG: hypothetical protein QXY39_03410 [Thermofilaceae archaeon]
MDRIAVVDSGHYLDFAVLLAERGHDVYYSVDWFRAFPRIEDYATGFGYDAKYPNFMKVIDPGIAIARADYVVFTDVGLGGLASYLESVGKKVWGATIPAQLLETDRYFMDRVTRERIGRQKEVILARGFDELRRAVKHIIDKYGYAVVKMSVFRGNMETQLVRSIDDLDVVLSQTNLEPIQDLLTFIVEQPAEVIEWGVDLYFDGEGFVRPYAHSPEMKGEGACFVRMVERSFLDDLFLDRLEEVLLQFRFRGFISLEFFLDGEKAVIIDYTVRLPYPGAGLLARIYSNLDELLISSMDGHPVKPKVAWQYGVEMRVYPEDNTRWHPWDIPRENWFYAGKRWSVYRGEDEKLAHFLFVPGGTDLGSAIGLSNSSIREAYEQAYRIAESYNAPDRKFSGKAWDIFEEKRAKVEEWYGKIY